MPQKKPIKKVIIIGTGNVAWQLGIAVYKAGYTITQVYGRNKKQAEKLAKKISSSPISSLSSINTNADLYIVAVNDDAIKQVAGNLSLNNNIVVHTSGSTDADALKKASTNYGVIYPLQTLFKNWNVDFSQVPLFIEGNNKHTERMLIDFSKTISKTVNKANSTKRKYIHLAAVFACNFSNHMFAIAEKISTAHHIPFSTFSPLINETARKAQLSSPRKQQTGPAIRGDKKTLKLQEKLLSKNPDLKKLYKLISKNISKA